MPHSRNHEAEEFYRQRDARTLEYLGRELPVHARISIEAGDDACFEPAGQLVLLTLVNQLTRFHRDVCVSISEPGAQVSVTSICGGDSLGDEVTRLAQRIDPYGHFRVDTQPGQGENVSIGIGRYCRTGLDWYLGLDRCVGMMAATPLPLGRGVNSDLRGAGVAAVLGASAAMKSVLGMPTVPRTLSAWNFNEGPAAAPGPEELLPVDVGRVLLVGAGAVAAGAVYWLMQWGQTGCWMIVDGDSVKLHNTNRCALYFPEDAGWFDGPVRSKSMCLAKYLSDAKGIDQWYDQSAETGEDFDTVLVLANERDVRTQVSHRNDPIQFQSTTGRDWLAQFHRHIVGIDGCVRCRMSDFKNPLLTCSEGTTATKDYSQRPDAALPFLSFASGLMLAAGLQRLQLGDFGTCLENRWNWDFKSTHEMASSGIRRCVETCTSFLPPRARQEIASVTRWRYQQWLQPALSSLHDHRTRVPSAWRKAI